jgi:hypothetical protein
MGFCARRPQAVVLAPYATERVATRLIADLRHLRRVHIRRNQAWLCPKGPRADKRMHVMRPAHAPGTRRCDEPIPKTQGSHLFSVARPD